jgi:hypothetical protein
MVLFVTLASEKSASGTKDTAYFQLAAAALLLSFTKSAISQPQGQISDKPAAGSNLRTKRQAIPVPPLLPNPICSFLTSPDGATAPLNLHDDIGDGLQARGCDGEGRGKWHVEQARLGRRHMDGEVETVWSRVVEAAPAPAGWRPAVMRLGGLEVSPKPESVVGFPKSQIGERNRREEASMTTRDGSEDLPVDEICGELGEVD